MKSLTPLFFFVVEATFWTVDLKMKRKKIPVTVNLRGKKTLFVLKFSTP